MKTSSLLEDITKKNQVDKISIDNILNTNEGSSYFVIFIMSVLSLIPTPSPLPIISSLFGTILIILSTQLLCGYKVLKLPKMIRNFSIKRSFIVVIVEKSANLLRKLEFFSKHRLTFYDNRIVMFLLNFFIFLMSICITIPMPLSNTVPAIAIVLLTFGILNNDGVFVIIGLISGVLGLGIFISCIFYGSIILNKLKVVVKKWF